MVNLRQGEVVERHLRKVAESVQATFVRLTILVQQGEAFHVLLPGSQLHSDFHLAKVLLVVHAYNLENMGSLRDKGEALRQTNLSHCIFLL